MIKEKEGGKKKEQAAPASKMQPFAINRKNNVRKKGKMKEVGGKFLGQIRQDVTAVAGISRLRATTVENSKCEQCVCECVCTTQMF